MIKYAPINKGKEVVSMSECFNIKNNQNKSSYADNFLYLEAYYDEGLYKQFAKEDNDEDYFYYNYYYDFDLEREEYNEEYDPSPIIELELYKNNPEYFYEILDEFLEGEDQELIIWDDWDFDFNGNLFGFELDSPNLMSDLYYLGKNSYRIEDQINLNNIQ